MHPILFRIGSFEFGTYGVLLVLGFFAALALARRMARRDGLAPEAISELAIAMLLGGVVGSKLLMVVVDLVRGVPPGEIFSLAYLRAGGAVHGGVILGAVVFFWRIRRMQLPLGQTMDAFAPAGSASSLYSITSAMSAFSFATSSLRRAAIPAR